MTASKIGRSRAGPVEKYSSSDIAGAHSWLCPRRLNCLSHSGHLHAGTRSACPLASPCSSRGVDQAIAHAWLGDEARSLGVLAQLLAQLAGVDPQVLRLPAVLGAPNRPQDGPVGDDPARMAGQGGEEPELLGRQVDLAAGSGDTMLAQDR